MSKFEWNYQFIFLSPVIFEFTRYNMLSFISEVSHIRNKILVSGFELNSTEQLGFSSYSLFRSMMGFKDESFACKFFISAVDNDSIHNPRLFAELSVFSVLWFIAIRFTRALSFFFNNQDNFRMGICVLEYARKHLHKHKFNTLSMLYFEIISLKYAQPSCKISYWIFEMFNPSQRRIVWPDSKMSTDK